MSWKRALVLEPEDLDLNTGSPKNSCLPWGTVETSQIFGILAYNEDRERENAQVSFQQRLLPDGIDTNSTWSSFGPACR